MINGVPQASAIRDLFSFSELNIRSSTDRYIQRQSKMTRRGLPAVTMRQLCGHSCLPATAKNA